LLIICEGPDCSGKTTLASRLVDALRANHPGDQVTYRHCGVPTEHPVDEYVAPLLDYRPGTGQHVVCDRFHVGETVYPTVTGRATRQTPAVAAYVELFLRSRGAVLVYCTATDEHLLDCGVARDDRPDELSRIPATTSAFLRAVGESLLPMTAVYVADPDVADYGDTVARILALADDEEDYAERLAPFTTYVGSPRPLLLLVGDRRGPARTSLADYGRWPAFVPRPATSGDYLLTTLTDARLRVPTHGLLLGDVGLANACDVDDVHDLWDVLERPRVVGLGVNARRALRNAHVPHDDAAHPQYQRRFLHHKRGDYLRSLLAVPAAVTA
jgi:hypothetical protein